MTTTSTERLGSHIERALIRALARARASDGVKGEHDDAARANETTARETTAAARTRDAVFALARARERQGKKRTRDDDDDIAVEDVDGGKRTELTSMELGFANASANAFARDVERARGRAREVLMRAGDETMKMEDLMREVSEAIERGKSDRARAEWRRGTIIERHRAMRAECATAEDADEAWDRCVSARDERALKSYAEAAKEVGNRAWVLSALTWVVDSIGAYFGDASESEKALAESTREVSWAVANKRRAKRLAKALGASFEDAMTEVEGDGAMGTPARGTSDVELLDVGSCWDYFGTHHTQPWPRGLRVTTTACDLQPSTKTVLACDWLRVKMSEDETTIDAPGDDEEFHRLVSVREHSYHALVFSLVLSYVPTASQRGEMVRRARLALMNRGMGLLFIITPHSTDKGHCPHKSLPILKEWRESIEALGFERVIYERQRSLHCLAFRTIGDGDEARTSARNPPELRIAFDAQVKGLKKT